MGQGLFDHEYSNDLFTLKFEILDNLSLNVTKNEKSKAIISSDEVNNNNLKIFFYLKKV
jgi:hypothetical protein